MNFTFGSHGVRQRPGPSWYLWFVFLLAAVLAPARAAVRVDYTVSISPNEPAIQVAGTITGFDGPNVSVAIPVWIPGYYVRINQYRFISGFEAIADGKPIEVGRPDSDTWSIPAEKGREIRFEYSVEAWEKDDTMGLMGVYVGRESAFFHPGSALMYVKGEPKATYTVRIKAPDSWDTAAPLPSIDGKYRAPDYETLVDSPFRVGAMRRLTFSARGKPCEIIVVGKCRVSDEVLKEITRKITLSAIELFHGATPFDRYQFQYQFPPDRQQQGYALEHRSSMSCVFSSLETDTSFPKVAATYVAHELFHAWNVKAIRPIGLGPIDFSKEADTSSLWFAEGFTQYYQYILMVRSGIWTPREALAGLARMVNDYRLSAGRLTTSAEQAGKGVWITGDSSSSGGTSYYTKGALIAWLLDLEIRARTKGEKSLDDAMRRMWDLHGAKDQPYPPHAFRDVLKSSTGLNLDESYNEWVSGTADLPFDTVLPKAGITIEDITVPDDYLGVSFLPSDRQPIVRDVSPNSVAWDACFEVGDVLISVDGKAYRRTGKPILSGGNRQVGDEVRFVVKRDDEEITLTANIRGRAITRLGFDESALPEARAVWDGLWESDLFQKKPKTVGAPYYLPLPAFGGATLRAGTLRS